MHRARVLPLLALLALLVGCVQSQAPGLPWDLMEATDRSLDVYWGRRVRRALALGTQHVDSVALDAARARVLLADRHDHHVTFYSVDLVTGEQHPLLKAPSDGTVVRVAYDPVTQLLLWKDGYSVHAHSLAPASSGAPRPPGARVVARMNDYCRDIALDSCGGYIYWIQDTAMERARLDGSERQVLIDYEVYHRGSLAIDQQTQLLYWTETREVRGDKQGSIKTADFNGENITTLYFIDAFYPHSLAVSRDYIYWRQDDHRQGLWRLPKNNPSASPHAEPTRVSSTPMSPCIYCHRIAANYPIMEQIEGVDSCDPLRRVLESSSEPQCTRSLCRNYCFQGECSVGAEGPECSCKAGYSGTRCQINACHDYCLNGGVCSVSEESGRVCQCAPGYEGDRCAEPAFLLTCARTVSVLKDMLNADVPPAPGTLRGVKSACVSRVV
ncbi:hypothetical protein PYW07_013144 [Mythimna separata]|uniref:Protein cueball n=1 Tax=Mythimna separata TaxID=271217 RepID=A0AAD7Y664_MYTSE|nr:hypothetical protein PYW07_013144 [Mythimna separata]